jgi:hypothetical protein
MNEQKGFVTRFGEFLDEYRADQRHAQMQGVQPQMGSLRHILRWFLPNGGTLLLIAALLLTQNVWARPMINPAAAPGPSATTVNYQGRLADPSGTPLSGTHGMSFSLWDADADGNLIWGPENHAAVPVSEGLFSVGLGSQTGGGIPTSAWNGDRYLEITVGGETLSPRELIRSVPVAGMALTVPVSSITTEMLEDGAVTPAKLDVSNGLGIGTINPLSRLDIIQGGANNDGLKTIGAFVRNPLGVPDSNDTALLVSGYAGNNPFSRLLDVQMADTSGNGAGTSVLTVRQDGNVGIGTTSPNESLHIIGNMLASGSKSAVVNTSHYGQRKLYAVESPEVRFSDEGLAWLVDGIARVDLDPIFLETIEGEYLVHVTPYGNASLYVAETGRNYFVVKAREGDFDTAFVWRLSAHRRGYEGVRLEPTDIEVPDAQEDTGR